MEVKWNEMKWPSGRSGVDQSDPGRWLNDSLMNIPQSSFHSIQSNPNTSRPGSRRAFTGHDDKDVQIDYPYTLVGFSLYTSTSSSSSSFIHLEWKGWSFHRRTWKVLSATSRVCEMNKTTTTTRRMCRVVDCHRPTPASLVLAASYSIPVHSMQSLV